MLLLISCYYATRIINRKYEYTTPQVSKAGWELAAKLHGTWQQHGQFQDLANPYSLMLWIEQPTGLERAVDSATVRLIAIQKADGTDVTPSGAAQIIAGTATESGTFFFLSQGFHLTAHTAIRILIKVSLLDSDGLEITAIEIEIDFEPIFEQYPSNRILDTMMSA